MLALKPWAISGCRLKYNELRSFPFYGFLDSNKYISLLLFILLFVLGNNGAAKTPEKLNLSIPAVRSAWVTELHEKSQAAKMQAEAWALARGIPIRYDDGWHIYELMYLDDNRPVYNITQNLNAAVSIATDLVRNTAPYSVNGSGMTIGIWDGGGVRSTHQEFGGRVSVMDGASSANHATHVAGTIGAVGWDPDALGMAPGVYIDSYDWTSDTAEMAARAASYPAEPGKIYASNHSYAIFSGWCKTNWSGIEGWHWNPDSTWNGANTAEDNFGQYDTKAHNYDEIAYNAPYYLIFKAAGNDRNDNPNTGITVYYSTDGGQNWISTTYSPSTCPPGDGTYKNGYDTISHRGIAKNVMTIGAVHDAVSGGARYLPNAAMAYFSSWGPADDGRIKPDIVANGIDLYSSTADCDNCYDTSSGTSQSSPGAAGSAILLADYYQTLFPGDAMLAGTLKGLIIHTADDLGNPGPDYSYGWGLMNTEAAAALIKQHYEQPSQNIIVEAVLDTANPVETYTFEWNGTGLIKTTLCWTDPPADAITGHDNTSPHLINDLDLRIIGPGGSPIFYPYVLDADNPSDVATTGDNFLDNIEQVLVSATGVSGTYTAQVTHEATLVNSEQTFSLITFKEQYVCCPNTISSYPYAEGFENDFVDWENSEDDDIEWIQQSGPTPSYYTGPQSAYEGLYYLYAEASGNSNKTAVLEGPCFELNMLTYPELRFWYHMHGDTMGILNVEISDDDCLNWNSLWSCSGEQGDIWQEATIDLTGYGQTTIRIRFVATIGSSYTSDIAIDYISVGELPLAPPVAEDCNASTRVNTSVTITLKATDEGLPDPPAALTCLIMSLPRHGTVDDPANGQITDPCTPLSSYGNQIIYTPDYGYAGSDSFTFKANDGGTPPDGGDSNIATVAIDVIKTIYSADMNTSPGWALDAGWEWGTPAGGGSHNYDPTSGCTGTNVVGYNLLGDYQNSIGEVKYATTPPIDCTGCVNIKLNFWRWLGVESSSFDHANIQVSGNAQDWTDVWNHTGGYAIADTTWQHLEYDISEAADNHAHVYVRWGMGPTDGSVTYPGWNIDDVEVTGLPIEPRLIFVDVNAAGANDGSTWSNAYNYLQDALADANSYNLPVEILVAAGIYKPDTNSANTTGSGEREATFQLINNVIIKGGYAGVGNPEPGARDIELFRTILTGDLDGNDAQVSDPCNLPSEPTRCENSYHVVTGTHADSTAVLDGFTVTGGNANGLSYPHQWGGGLIDEFSGDSIIRNCVFTKNSANGGGGGMANDADTSPIAINCRFTDNWGPYGGGLLNNGMGLTLIKCSFTNNRAIDGGGMEDYYSSGTTLVNCDFSGNRATSGGGMCNGDNSQILINCVFIANLAASGGGMRNSQNSNSNLANCTFALNSASEGNTLLCESDQQQFPSDVEITNSILWDGGTQIVNKDGSAITITYSDVQGGWSGQGNISLDPMFVREPNDGGDGWGDDPCTPAWDEGANDDYGNLRLSSGSPCIDAADNNSVPLDTMDLDNDGNTAELIPLDLNNFARFIDDICTTDTGNGTAPIVDMGAYEFLRSDIDSAGFVDFKDYCILAEYWLETGCGICGGAELTCDGRVGMDDLQVFTSNWLWGR